MRAGLKATLRIQPLHEKQESEETFERPLDKALSSIDSWMDAPREPDEYGALGMPPLSAHIVIDGASVAWGHGERKKFSTEGLNKVQAPASVAQMLLHERKMDAIV